MAFAVAADCGQFALHARGRHGRHRDQTRLFVRLHLLRRPVGQGQARSSPPTRDRCRRNPGPRRPGRQHVSHRDSEFNIPPEHGRAVCEAIIAAGLGDSIRWYAYCSPTPFDEATAQLYRRAGCRGINFGCDSGDDGMLERYGRAHRRADILAAVAATKAAGMSCMIDLLLGGPAESPGSLRRTLEMARSSGADRVGLSVGIRVYSGTLFARMYLDDMSARPGEILTTATQPDLLQPYFWIEPSLGYAVHDILREEVGNDPRFFFMDPARTTANYNYNGNSALVQAIRKGYRGAFWDILRRVAENLPPE